MLISALVFSQVVCQCNWGEVVDYIPDISCADHFWLEWWKLLKISQQTQKISPKWKWFSFFLSFSSVDVHYITTRSRVSWSSEMIGKQTLQCNHLLNKCIWMKVITTLIFQVNIVKLVAECQTIPDRATAR